MEDFKILNSKRSLIIIIIVVAIISSGIGAAFAISVTGKGNNNVISQVTKQPETNSTVQPIINNSESPAIMIAQKVGPAVVGISNKGNAYGFNGQTDTEQGSGSGVIIDKKGYIVTNNHVVEGATQLTVSLTDGRHVDAKLVGSDPQTDLAVLKIDANNLTAAIMGDSNKDKVGEMVVAIGNPLGEEFAGSVTQGIISALNRTISIGERDFKVIQTDAAINPGNSGGALVNATGELIGINSAKLKLSGVEGMGFSIPISDVSPIIKQLIANGHISRPWLGIQGLSADTSAKNSIPGVTIVDVIAGSPADKAGIIQGDIIKSINGETVKDMNGLRDLLTKFKPKDKVTLKIQRSNQDKDLSVTLGEMPTSK